MSGRGKGSRGLGSRVELTEEQEEEKQFREEVKEKIEQGYLSPFRVCSIAYILCGLVLKLT